MAFLNMLAIPFVPPVEDWTSDEDGGEGSSQDAQQENQGEVDYHTGPQKIEGKGRQQGSQTGDQGAR